jgi:pimeloyl-ACP methyl ester carboxylesterase
VAVAEREPAYCVIPGAGSSGLSWTQTLGQLGGTLLQVPDEPDVPAMSAALAPRVRDLSSPLVLVGASLGAMVALELARTIHVDALVLIAAGFGIEVSDSLLQWIAGNPPDLLEKVAKASIAAPDDEAMVALVARDFASRGQPVLLRHLTALGRYRPQPLGAPPPTVVIWGVGDHSVPLADHVELALRCRGAVAPLSDAGHMPFLERPTETVRWIRTAAQLLHPTTGEDTSNDQRDHLSNLD